MGYISGHEGQQGPVLSHGFREAGPRPSKPGALELGGRASSGGGGRWRWVAVRGGAAEVPASAGHSPACAGPHGPVPRWPWGLHLGQRRSASRHAALPMGMPGCARTLRTRAVGSQAASLHLQPRGHPSSVRLEAIAGPRAWLPVPRVPRPLQVCVPGHPGTRPRADSCPGPTEARGGPPQLLPGRGVDWAQRLSCSEKGWVPG